MTGSKSLGASLKLAPIYFLFWFLHKNIAHIWGINGSNTLQEEA
jgi:hypothetical protein